MNLQEKMYLSKKEGIEEERLNGIYKAYTGFSDISCEEIALKKTAELYNISEDSVKEVLSSRQKEAKNLDDQ